MLASAPHVRWRAGSALVSAALLVACDGAVGSVHPHAQAKIRPTQGDSTVYRGYGAEGFEVYDSPAGDHRVWYARAGEHAVPSDDRSPDDGVPDFVQRVGETADDVLGSLIDAGWRAPLSDTDLGPRRSPDDGAGFDIYLVNFERADGLYFSEACTPSRPARCSGYIAMENDFARSGYRNYEEGVRVLVSHEYFHAVQAAYASELPAWLSEGTATWHEEAFDASQQDFEHLAAEFFRHPGRSLNGPPRGGFDSFSYGAAVFAFFIAEHLGEPVLIDAFEQIALGASAEDALVEAIGRLEPFDLIFGEFAAWTLATGERALPSFGFPMADELPTLEAVSIDGGGDLNWDIAVDPWAAAGAVVERPRALRLELRALEGWSEEAVLVVVSRDGAGGAEAHTLRVGEALEVEAGDPLWIAVANPGYATETAARVAFRGVSADGGLPEGSGEGSGGLPPPGPVDAGDGTGAAGCSTGAPAGGLAAWAGIAAIAWIRRRSLTPLPNDR